MGKISKELSGMNNVTIQSGNCNRCVTYRKSFNFNLVTLVTIITLCLFVCIYYIPIKEMAVTSVIR